MPRITILPSPIGHARVSITDVLGGPTGTGQNLTLQPSATATEFTGGYVDVAAGLLVRAVSRRIIGDLSWAFIKWTDEDGSDLNIPHHRFEFTATTEDRTLVAVYEELFNAEIKYVDPTKSLTYIVDPTYDILEFSYSGLTIRGGGRLACEYGAMMLLDAMGFRFYSSAPWGTIRPVSIPTNLTRSRGWLWMKSNGSFSAYGPGWPDAVPKTATGVTSLDAFELAEALNRWEVLNGLNGSAYPQGHRWPAVISSNLDWFRAIPPGGTVARAERMLTGGLNSIPPKTADSAGAHFNLTPGHLTPTELAELEHLCAATLLWDGQQINPEAGRTFQEFQRASFDPSDGDLNSSDTVYPFSQRVCQKMRAGTAAISNKPEMAAAPNAQLGVYGYAGHEFPPTVTCEPEIYIGAALAFKSPFNTDTFEEWFHKLTLKSDFGTIRDYWDTMLWSRGMPMSNVRLGKTYMDRYDAFVAFNCRGMSTENSTNWLASLVGFRWGIKKLQTGTTSWNDALDDIMEKLFNEDPAVRELYDTLWGEVSVRFNKYTLRYSFDLVDQMAEGWYKELFKKYMVICKRFLYLPLRTLKDDNPSWPDVASGDPFPAAFLQWMKNVVAMRMQEPAQCWGFVARFGNTHVSQHYPHLWSGRKNNNVATREKDPIPGFPTYPDDPDYYTNPVAPTEQDWLDEYAAITADTVRDEDLDGEIVDGVPDLVLVRGVVPNVVIYDPVETPDAAGFFTEQSALYGFVGPGSVIFTDAKGGVPTPPPVGITDVETFGPGFHEIDSLTRARIATNSGGELFLNSFPSCYRRTHQPAQTYQFLYVQNRAKQGTATADPRWSFHDDSLDVNGERRLDASGRFPARFDLAHPTKNPDGWIDPVLEAGLGPGQIMVDNINTTGTLSNAAYNKWISKKANIVLLPRVIAEEDFPNRARVAVVPP